MARCDRTQRFSYYTENMRQNSQELVNTDHIFPGVYYKPEAEGFESKKHIVVKAKGSNSIFLAVVLTRSLSNV